jgi:hypothetical protein
MNRFKISLIVFILSAFTNNTLKAQTNKEALEYLDKLSVVIGQTKDESWQYLKAITNGKNARKVEAKRQNLIASIKKTRDDVEKMPKFQDDSLRLAVLDYLNLRYIVLNEDFARILDLEDIAEQSYDAMEAYLLAKEKANEKLDISFDKVIAAQEKFAKSNGINLVKGKEDKTTEKISKANNILSYYNQVYLIFFKVYKQEMYVLDAMQKNDINGFEQNVNTFKTYANEGLDKLKTVQGYKGDGSLKAAAQKMITFYKSEAEKDFPAVSDFYIKKDNFEKLKQAMDAKGEKNRTQQDVDQYNKALNDFNKAVQTVNRISDAANTKRAQYLNEWNSKVDYFFEIHNK